MKKLIEDKMWKDVRDQDMPGFKLGAEWMYDHMLEDMKRAIDVLKIASKEIDHYYSIMKQESRKQTVYSDDHSLWYARDEADVLLHDLKAKYSGIGQPTKLEGEDE